MPTIQPAQTWVSQAGVAWALDEAPCPHDLLATLIAIARRTGPDGRGAWESVPAIAAKVGKSVRQVREDIKRLIEAKLIEPGDQGAIPAEVPAGKRPVVYDLVLSNKGAKPLKSARNPGGKNKRTPAMDSTPATESTGAMGSACWGALESTGWGAFQSTQIPAFRSKTMFWAA